MGESSFGTILPDAWIYLVDLRPQSFPCTPWERTKIFYPHFLGFFGLYVLSADDPLSGTTCSSILGFSAAVKQLNLDVRSLTTLYSSSVQPTGRDELSLQCRKRLMFSNRRRVITRQFSCSACLHSSRVVLLAFSLHSKFQWTVPVQLPHFMWTWCVLYSTYFKHLLFTWSQVPVNVTRWNLFFIRPSDKCYSSLMYAVVKCYSSLHTVLWMLSGECCSLPAVRWMLFVTCSEVNVVLHYTQWDECCSSLHSEVNVVLRYTQWGECYLHYMQWDEFSSSLYVFIVILHCM